MRASRHADLLVNNAGLGWYGYGDQMSWKTAQEMLQVNVEAVVQLSLTFLAKMRLRNAGHIINIGSISGSLPSQGIALYGATKSFLDNFTTALQRELAGTHVHVSVVRAGPVKTEFVEAAPGPGKWRAYAPGNDRGKLGKGSRAHLEVWSAARAGSCTYRGIYESVPWLELSFGWIIDRVGPLLLKNQKTTF